MVERDALAAHDPIGSKMDRLDEAVEMKLPEIDGERIRAIIARTRDLHNRGLMDRATWLERNKEFAAACRGRLEMPSALIDSAKNEWFEDLQAGTGSLPPESRTTGSLVKPAR